MSTVWDGVPVPRFPSLQQDVSADVCVVGCGIAGLTTAYLLLKEGKSVVLLDEKNLGRGETGLTSAHLSNALDDRYYALEKIHGEHGARLAAESHTAAINRIERIAHDENISCEFARVDGYLFAGRKELEPTLEAEFHAARRAGIFTIEWANAAPWKEFDTGKCLRFPNQAQFHPLKYLFGLAQTVKKMGGQIYTNSRAVECHGGASTSVLLKQGSMVRAKAIVLATNVPINNRVAIHTKQVAYRTYVIGVRIPHGSIERALYWDNEDPYHYVRLESDPKHSADEILIVGGEDHRTGEPVDYENRYDRLEAWARSRFPFAKAIEYKWSGQIIEPVDGLAFIGRNPADHDNVFIITGDSGNGLTHGTIGGMLITDLIMERENPWRDLYNPSRLPLHTIKDYVKQNADVLPKYTEWVTPGEIKSESYIEPGTGKIIRRGAQKIAAYRDKDGKLRELSAVCPHLGCIVHWNSAEQTWDCPCHGSRFDPEGTVVNGPANSNLHPIHAELKK